MNDTGELLADVVIATDEDVILARQRVRAVCQEFGFSMLDQTRVVTAVSELGRNIVVHAGKGRMVMLRVTDPVREGLEIRFEDAGPGIADVEMAMTDGYSTAGSMGLGLRGASRLVDDFHIDTGSDRGTTVTIRKWR